jgi:hypothetical protein
VPTVPIYFHDATGLVSWDDKTVGVPDGWYSDLAHTTKAPDLPDANSAVILLTLPAAGPAAPLTIASFDCQAIDADVPASLATNLTVTGLTVTGHTGRVHSLEHTTGSLTMHVAGIFGGIVSGGVATFNGATYASVSNLSAASKVVWNSTGTPETTTWPALVELVKPIDLTVNGQAYSAPTVIYPLVHLATALVGNAGDTGTVKVDPSRLLRGQIVDA